MEKQEFCPEEALKLDYGIRIPGENLENRGRIKK